MEALLAKLEYEQIIERVANYCKTYLGKKRCLAMQPQFQFEEVQALLTETEQAISLLFRKGTPSFFEIDEVEPYLKALASEQAISMKGLLTIAKLLNMCDELRTYFYGDESFDISSFSAIEKYFAKLYTNPSIEKNIFDKIIDENTVADNASSKLASLRKNRKSLEQQVKDKLNSYLHSSTYAKYIMEPIVTIRNNRYVIPVKEEYRDKINGFIHDTSSSGSTLYIEPTAVFEWNNQIHQIQAEEEIEIEKILQILSASLFGYVEELANNLRLIAILDLIFAKAKYGIDQDDVVPTLNQENFISLSRAKHPLISKEQVVPIDIALGKDYTSLLITGPNTGGKTVALKTIGLLLLMAYSGIPIPCHETSSICVFSQVFADIGDEQSIQESLSTFSAHMKNIVEITNQADSNTLVLLDELGSGTDPLEGASLAMSVLNFLQSQGSLVCCTTHYHELKEFALVTEGFENASFEFDLENLKPTYRLLIGVPGRSNAFAISKRLGLNPQILENASSFLKEDTVHIEELLKSIYEDKLVIEKQKEETVKNLHQAESLRKSLEKNQNDVEQKRKELLEKAKMEARDLLLSAKEEVNEIIKELEQTQDTKQANHLRNHLNEKMASVNRIPANAVASSHEKTPSLKREDVKKDLAVYVIPLQANGIVLSDSINKAEEVQIQVGSMKMNMKLQNLRKLNNAEKISSHGVVTTKQESKSQTVSSEINVIGQNVEEAVALIDKYLDNCYLAHFSPVRIVHGKGTGKLRQGIHAYLKTNSHVKSYRLGTFGEGEMGVTIVELK
ncbi:MAG: endonuclease MutS2 [Clostridia bacterium]|nr:endonuclease MutS2 [Clostridia bacterium]